MLGTKRCSSDSLNKLAVSLSDAQVDLNPHQIEAALFAFRSPLSKGALLADEVGLGKTIEAGIIISQKWAERKRTILIIVPANLRKQWNEEMLDKFFLPSVILEKGSFNEQIAKGNLNPFNQKEKIVICSYHFARAKDAYIKQTKWDLVIIDEAHRLRNVYKESNKIANAIIVAMQPPLFSPAWPRRPGALRWTACCWQCRCCSCAWPCWPPSPSMAVTAAVLKALALVSALRAAAAERAGAGHQPARGGGLHLRRRRADDAVRGPAAQELGAGAQ